MRRNPVGVGEYKGSQGEHFLPVVLTIAGVTSYQTPAAALCLDELEGTAMLRNDAHSKL